MSTHSLHSSISTDVLTIMKTEHSTPKLNFLIQSKTDTKVLSKAMKYFFVILHVIFALDFGFIKHKSPKLNTLIKSITLAQSTAFSIVLGLTFFDPTYKNVYTYSAFFLDTLLYYAFTLILVVAKTTFHDYQIDLYSFDVEINLDSSTCRVEYKIMFWFFLLIIYRIFIFILYYVYSLDYIKFPIYSQLIYYIGVVGLDTVLIVYTYVFYAAYLRLKNFTKYVDNSPDIISCQYLYKNLVDIIEKVKKTFDFVLVLTLLANTTDVTMHVYLPFAKESLKSAAPLHVVAAYVIVIQQMVALFSPAFTAGLLAGQAEKLRLVLYNKLMYGGGPTDAKDIKRFVSYVEGRPLRFKVWRVVPLDWRLPVIVVNISVTYLIVMIQFTHKN